MHFVSIGLRTCAMAAAITFLMTAISPAFAEGMPGPSYDKSKIMAEKEAWHAKKAEMEQARKAMEMQHKAEKEAWHTKKAEAERAKKALDAQYKVEKEARKAEAEQRRAEKQDYKAEQKAEREAKRELYLGSLTIREHRHIVP